MITNYHEKLQIKCVLFSVGQYPKPKKTLQPSSCLLSFHHLWYWRHWLHRFRWFHWHHRFLQWFLGLLGLVLGGVDGSVLYHQKCHHLRVTQKIAHGRNANLLKEFTYDSYIRSTENWYNNIDTKFGLSVSGGANEALLRCRLIQYWLCILHLGSSHRRWHLGGKSWKSQKISYRKCHFLLPKRHHYSPHVIVVSKWFHQKAALYPPRCSVVWCRTFVKEVQQILGLEWLFLVPLKGGR